jgi:hypothetical protein
MTRVWRLGRENKKRTKAESVSLKGAKTGPAREREIQKEE